jgi:E3 ubiquitin-protein ligase CHFR
MEAVHDLPSQRAYTISEAESSLAHDNQPSTSTLKRPPSPSFEGLDDEITRKRFKQDLSEDTEQTQIESESKYDTLVEDLAQELQCGCCAELVYRPVVVSPCQHFFCGRCVQLVCAASTKSDELQLLCALDQGEFLETTCADTSTGGNAT